MNNSLPKFAYYSHHKCASTWTNSILREICFHLGWRHRTAHGTEQYGLEGGLRPWVEKNNVEFLAYTNAEIDEAQTLPPHRGFHVVRDPRDVLVSAYFSHKYSHGIWPELRDHRRSLQSLTKEDGLLKEIEFSRQFLIPMRDWDYDQDHILEVKMETLTAQPRDQFQSVFDHLGLKLTEEGLITRARQKVNRVVYALHHRIHKALLPSQITMEKELHSDVWVSILKDHAFEKLSGGRSKGEEDPESHYRKGEPGDWKNHFTDRVEKKFKKVYGNIVQKLGYEK